jgi:hypothetical protein
LESLLCSFCHNAEYVQDSAEGMTIFELVRIALDELYAEAAESYGSKADAQISSQIACLQSTLRNLNRGEPNPTIYKDPTVRFAYVFKYVTSHADYVVQILQKLRQKLDGSIFDKESIRVSCVGGGPGSDLIGLLKYLDENHELEPAKKITCYLLDREQAWADTWTELRDKLDSSLNLNNIFQPLDVTKPETWAQQKRFLQADLFIMSYFLSEVYALDSSGGVTAFFRGMFDQAKSGALFLYDDNGHEDFNKYFDSLFDLSLCETVISGTNMKLTPRYSEEKSALGDYLNKFGQSPKLGSHVSYRVIRKL